MRAATVDGSSLTGRLAFLLYGSGLRLLECARLRVKDLDFATRQIGLAPNGRTPQMWA